MAVYIFIILMLFILIIYLMENTLFIKEGMEGESDCKDEEEKPKCCNENSEKITDIQNQIDQLSSQVDSLVQQQADLAQDLAGDEPVEVTGTDLSES